MTTYDSWKSTEPDDPYHRPDRCPECHAPVAWSTSDGSGCDFLCGGSMYCFLESFDTECPFTGTRDAVKKAARHLDWRAGILQSTTVGVQWAGRLFEAGSLTVLADQVIEHLISASVLQSVPG